MPSRIHCPACQAAFAYSATLLGKTVQCGKCSHRFTVAGPANELAVGTIVPDPAARPILPPPLPPRRPPSRPAERGATASVATVPPEAAERTSRRRPEPRERAGDTGVLYGLAATVVFGFFVLIGGVIFILWPNSARPTAAAATGPTPVIESPMSDEPPKRLEDILRDAPPRAGDGGGAPEFPRFAPPPFAPPPRPGPVGPPPGALPGPPAGFLPAPPRPAGTGPKFADVMPLPITPARFAGDRAEILLPGPVEAVTVAGGGRLVLLHSPFRRKVFVFDVSEARVTKVIDVPDPGAMLAGGMNLFVIYQPQRQVIERWNCQKLEREAEVRQPFADPARAMAMGSASNGPLAVALGGTRGAFNDGYSLALFDPGTFREVRYTRAGQKLGGIGDKHGAPAVRVSADGRVVTGWGVNGISGAESNIVSGGRLSRRWYLQAPRPLLPSPDGRVLHAPGLQVTADLADEPARQLDPAVHFVPAVHGDWYVAVRRSDEFGLRAQRQVRSLDIYRTGGNRLLQRFEVTNEVDLSRAEYGLDQSVILIPDAKVLITVAGPKRSTLVLRRVDLK